MELTGAHWRMSSRGGADDVCVEAATNLPELVGVPDSKGPVGPVLTFAPYARRFLVAALPR
ncbi:DUF397 domain-containing protein [Micromonospora sp. NBRC 101691]|uniref:DUF397 domain-containing protein n=1 Tax=Micromonospora sp. NBRC 101691 TaxID=3032198 RepID=UPI0024A1C669|nr:DUF397 domain-containing protein [Micromonospora sp. NBRC 101691]GLY23423.1 hypothetical protein Misp04_31550 [Micromonospora sp. NBRC 101691]